MRLVVGRIIRPHGLHGEVVVQPRTDSPEQRFAAGPLTVAQARPHQGRLLVVLTGVADRDAAEALRGVLLCVDSADLPAPDDPDEFHDHQLVGLRALTRSGEWLGDVVRVDHAPASDLLVLRLTDGRSALVPFVRAIVTEVDLPGRRVVLDPPAGLLDL